MIFGPLTFGFIAESIREHPDGKSKKREYLSSMVSEPQYGTALYSHLLQELLAASNS